MILAKFDWKYKLYFIFIKNLNATCYTNNAEVHKTISTTNLYQAISHVQWMNIKNPPKNWHLCSVSILSLSFPGMGILMLNVILCTDVVHHKWNIVAWNWSNTINSFSALWILMAWCFSTRASVATVLRTHPCVSSCLGVTTYNNVNQYLILSNHACQWGINLHLYGISSLHVLIPDTSKGCDLSWEDYQTEGKTGWKTKVISKQIFDLWPLHVNPSVPCVCLVLFHQYR